MQVKPRFKSYKILEQYPLFKDDTGNEFCLTLLEVMLPDSSDFSEIIETTYTYWVVCGKRLETWGNNALSFNSYCFYKNKIKNPLYKNTINGFVIEEKVDGEHYHFLGPGQMPQEIDFGLRTKIEIRRIK